MHVVKHTNKQFNAYVRKSFAEYHTLRPLIVHQKVDAWTESSLCGVQHEMCI